MSVVMLSSDSARTAIVDALDELGERDRLSYAQRTASDEPYPSSVVQERLTAVQQGKRVAWAMLVAAGAIVIVFYLGYGLDWALTDFVGGLLWVTVPLAGIGAQNLAYYARAEALYNVLKHGKASSDEDLASSSNLASV